jgi:CBS domain-containing protein
VAEDKSMEKFIFLKVKDVMTQEVRTVSPKTTAGELRVLFERYDFNCFPVLDDGRLVGVVTKFDFLKILVFRPTSMTPQYEELMKRPVSEFMTGTPFTIGSDHPLTRVLELMIETRKNSFPVLDERGHLVGIITYADVLRYVG